MNRTKEIISNAFIITFLAWIGWIIIAFVNLTCDELIKTLQTLSIHILFTFIILSVLCWRLPEVTFFSKGDKICSTQK